MVDTLGAGDALIAAVIAAHVRGADMQTALMIEGARAAALHLHHHYGSLGGGVNMTHYTTRSPERSHDLRAQVPPRRVGSGTRSPRSGWKPPPMFAPTREGSSVADEDGNEYIDYQMGQGPLILGHRPQPVIEAVTATLTERGSLFSLAHDLEGQAADGVRAPAVGGPGAVRQLRHASAAYALRFARAFDRTPPIVRFEGHYHGWTDAIHWSAHPSPDETGAPADAPTRCPATTGSPRGSRETLLVAPWNDTASARALFERARRADRGGHHRADPGQLRGDLARPPDTSSGCAS